jgi:hypothetical protein
MQDYGGQKWQFADRFVKDPWRLCDKEKRKGSVLIRNVYVAKTSKIASAGVVGHSLDKLVLYNIYYTTCIVSFLQFQ